MNIFEILVKVGAFGKMGEAVSAADLGDVLSGPGPFTVFAPDDKAVEQLSPGEWEKLLADKKKLRSVLKYHVVKGSVSASDLSKSSSVNTLQGETVSVGVDRGVLVNGVRFVKPDIKCSNGVIHVIDGVLIPSKLEKPAPA